MEPANDSLFDNTLELDMLPGQSMRIDLDEPATAGWLWRIAKGPASALEASLRRPATKDPTAPARPGDLRVGARTRASLHLVAPPSPAPIDDRIELVLDRPFSSRGNPLRRLIVRARVSTL